MDIPKPESPEPEGIRSVKAAIGLYGGRFAGSKPDGYKTIIPITEELRFTKDEVRQLKLRMKSAIESKTKAEKEIESCAARTRTYETSAEEILKQIEKADEDHVLVELARIEAERELRDIELQRETDSTTFTKYIETARKKITDLNNEIARAKEFEIKLAATNFEINQIKREIELVRTVSSGTPEKRSERAQDTSSLQKSAMVELNKANKELKTIKEEGFQCMFSMDRIREELMNIRRETERLNKIETEAESTVRNLSSKLLRAKSKLEHAIVSEERAKEIFSNLASALQRIQAEIEAAKKDKEVISQEKETIEVEKEKVDKDIKQAEEGLQSAMQELEAVKESEQTAMKKLRHVRERLMRSRASSSPHSSTITISKFEYDYMRKRAAAAKFVADKKVSAAQAWIAALKASEKEILMKSNSISREAKKIIVMEEQEMKDVEESNMQLVATTSRKSMRDNGAHVVRRAKMRRLSAFPGTVYNPPRSPSFAMKRRTKVLPKFGQATQTPEKLVRS